MKAIVILVALLVSAAALPAHAVMLPVGAVVLVPVNTGTAVEFANLWGDILALTARGDADVGCHAVIATYSDGSYTEIFHGVLPPDELFKVYLPGGVRDIRRIEFNCLSVDRGRASIEIEANVVPDRFIAALP